MRFNTITLVASTLALTSAAPTNTKPTNTGNTNIDYCASKGLINALNCVKLLNDLNIDLDILKKREAEAEPEPLLGLGGGGSSKQPASSGPSETNISYCSSQGLLNLANCLDILNDVDVDVDILKKEKRDWQDGTEWTDDTPRAPVTSTTKPTPTPTKPVSNEQPPKVWTDSGLSDADVKVCKSKGLLNALNCLNILNNLNLSVGILNSL